jgi:uncharacterized protein (DUF2461 family)
VIGHDGAVSELRGFSSEAIELLRELEDNNDRDWFKANRARYDEHLVAPAKALGEDLADLGRPHLFRPWNDTRFRAGPPIKEHVGLAIGYEGAGGSMSRSHSTGCWWPRGCTTRRRTRSSACGGLSTRRVPPRRSPGRSVVRRMRVSI